MQTLDDIYRIFLILLLMCTVVALFSGCREPKQWEEVDQQVGMYIEQGEYEQAEEKAREALAAAAREYGKVSDEYTVALSRLGYALQKQKRYSDAVAYFEEELRIDEVVSGAASTDVAVTLVNISNCYNNLGQLSRAEQAGERALEIMEKSVDVDAGTVVAVQNHLGAIYHAGDNYSQAIDVLEEALAVLSTDVDDKYLETAVLMNLILSYTEAGQVVRADSLMQRALQIDTAVLDGILTGSLKNAAGRLAHEKGEYREAEERLHQALAVYRQSGNENSEYAAIALNNLGSLYSDMKRYREADSVLNLSLQFYTTRGMEYVPGVAVVLNNIGTNSMADQEYERAEWALQKALQVWEVSTGENSASVAAALMNLVNLYRQMGHSKEALALEVRLRRVREMNKAI